MFLKPMMFTHWAIKSKHKLQFFESGTVFHKRYKVTFFSNIVPSNGHVEGKKFTFKNDFI